MSNKPKPLKEHTNQELIERARNTMVGVVMYDINQEMSNRLESADATLEKVRVICRDTISKMQEAQMADEGLYKMGITMQERAVFGFQEICGLLDVKENNDDNQN